MAWFEFTLPSETSLLRMMDLFKERQITNIHLTHTSSTIDRIPLVKKLQAEFPGLEISYTLSVKYHSPISFQTEFDRAREIGLKNFLIVSGHPKKEFDTLAALTLIDQQASDLTIGCAYNPFLNHNEQTQEDERLKQKLDHACVKNVYLQIGVDQEKIKMGLRVIKNLRSNISIFGEIVIPNPTILEKLKQKPWHGVALPEEYLNNLTVANQQTEKLLEFYHENNITPLLLDTAIGG